MPTWAELKTYARSKYTLENEGDEGFTVKFEFENERTQLVGIHRFTAFDRDWIEFRTYVCHESNLLPEEALRRNDDFMLGGLALDEAGDYCLLYSLPVAVLNPEQFDTPLTILARTADKLEQHYAGADDH